jgi:DNA-binding HxlR family transcriptional regulator
VETAITAGTGLTECATGTVAGVCPVTHTLNLMNGKWTLLVVRELLDGTKRFTEIRRRLADLNPRTLAERLKLLERDGIVVRQAFAEVPPRVEYSLTPRGRSLASVLEAMGEWGTRDLLDRA